MSVGMGRLGAFHRIHFLHVLYVVQMSRAGRASPGAHGVWCNPFDRMLYDAGGFGALAQAVVGVMSGDLLAFSLASIPSRRLCSGEDCWRIVGIGPFGTVHPANFQLYRVLLEVHVASAVMILARCLKGAWDFGVSSNARVSAKQKP